MLGRAKALGHQLKVRDIELPRNACGKGQSSGLPRITRYVTFSQEIGPDEAGVLNGIPRKTRAAVRKSLKEGSLPPAREILCLATNIFEDLYSQEISADSARPAFLPNTSPRYWKNFAAWLTFARG